MKTSPPNELSLYFLHIEKTAGMSLSSYLDNFFPAKAVCHTTTWQEIMDVPSNQLAQYRFFRGHFGYSLTALLPKMPEIITVLRNPVDRVLSHYQASIYEYRNSDLTPPSVEDFLDNPNMVAITHNFQTRSIASSIKMPNRAPMWEDLPIEALYDLAIERLETFAVVGLTEQFDTTVALIAHQFGFFPPLAPPRINVTAKRPLREDLNPALIERITALNDYDQRLYDYGTQLFERQYSEMMFELLLDHNLPERPTVTDRIDFTFDQPIHGIGWHPREALENGQVFCWSGSTASLLFRLAGKTDLKLRLSVYAVVLLSQFETISLYLNGVPLAMQVVFEENQYALTAVLPKAAIQKQLKGYAHLVIQVGQTLVPNEIGLNKDIRRLGIALNRVQIEPV